MDPAGHGGFDRLEIAVAGPASRAAERDLAEHLREVPGLHVEEGPATSYDAAVALAVAGSIAGIIQGVDVLWRWYRGRRAAGEAFRVTVRSRSGGHLELRTQSVDEAVQLVEQLKRALDGRPGPAIGPPPGAT